MSNPGPELPACLGEIIGDYRLETVIGHGGMGTVYSAVHVRSGRSVAIKVLAKGYAEDRAFVSRCLHEANAVRSIRHPSVASIYDFIISEHPNRGAYVMERVRGAPLAEALSASPLAPRLGINLCLQLVDALEAAHATRVIHCDLKPHNVLVVGYPAKALTEESKIKVLDFGIANVQTGNSDDDTVSPLMVGTPLYMAPEQILGEPITTAVDVYALGELIYETLSGRRLFDGPTRVVLQAKLAGRIPTMTLPDPVDTERLRELLEASLSLTVEERPALSSIRSALVELRAAQPAEQPRSAAVILTSDQDLSTPGPLWQDLLLEQGSGSGPNEGQEDTVAIRLPQAESGKSRRGPIFGLGGAIAVLGLAAALFVWRGGHLVPGRAGSADGVSASVDSAPALAPAAVAASTIETPPAAQPSTGASPESGTLAETTTVATASASSEPPSPGIAREGSKPGRAAHARTLGRKTRHKKRMSKRKRRRPAREREQVAKPSKPQDSAVPMEEGGLLPW